MLLELTNSVIALNLIVVVVMLHNHVTHTQEYMAVAKATEDKLATIRYGVLQLTTKLQSIIYVTSDRLQGRQEISIRYF